MATTIGLPSLTITFQKAAQATANRSKKGYVGVFVRDSQAQGVHQLTSAALIPSELGADNQAYLARAFTGTDRGQPSKVVAVVIATGTEDTTALEAGLKLIENQSLDYIAPPPDVTEAEKTLLETWVKERRKDYFTEKLVEANPIAPPDDMGIISFKETDGAIAAGKTTYTAAQYASRIAGALAGIPMGMSCTYAALEELTAVTPRSETEQKTAINEGNLILIHDGQVAKMGRGVNSLTTIPATGNADWSKIKIVEGMDLITYYLRTTIQGQYIGRYGKVQKLRESLSDDVSVHILLQGCVEPDLKAPALRERYGGATPAETVKAMLLPGEIEDLSRAVEKLCGYRRTTIDEVKNA